MSKREKTFSIISIVLNILTIGAVIGSFVYSFFLTGEEALMAKGFKSLKFYTVLSNLLLAILTVPLLVHEIMGLKDENKSVPLYATILKFLGVAGTTITFLTVVCFLSPMEVINGGSYFTMFIGSNFIYHLVAPLLALISFTIFESNSHLKFKETPFGLISVVAYAIFYILNLKFHFMTNGKDNVYDWYGFLGNDGNRSIWIVVVIMLVASYAICLLLWALKLLFGHLLFAKVPMPIEEKAETEKQEESKENEKIEETKEPEQVKEEEPKKEAQSEESEDKPEETQEPSDEEIDVEIDDTNEDKNQKSSTKIPSNKTNTYNGKTRTYHISKVEGKGWQVKLATGKKAIKYFPTQKEAIAYAKSLSLSQGGSVRIHSVKGKMRK